MQEIWKDIEGYEGTYQISSLGNIKSLPRKTNNQFYKGIYLKQTLYKGYLKVQLSNHSKSKWFLVHRLVAMAFIPNPQNKPQVNHIDGNKSNNKVSNLEWVTGSENQIHSYHVLKTIPSMKNHFGSSHVASKAIYQFSKKKEFIKKWESIIEATNSLNICACNITDCAKGNRKTAGGFIWKYTI